MRVRVECHPGYLDGEEPRAVTVGNRRYEVFEVLDRWIAPGCRYFKAQGDDGSTLILRHNEASGDWDLQ